MVHSSGVGRAVSTGKAVIYHSVPDVIDTRTEVWGGGGLGRKVISFRHPSGSVRERGPYYLRCVWVGGVVESHAKPIFTVLATCSSATHLKTALLRSSVCTMLTCHDSHYPFFQISVAKVEEVFVSPARHAPFTNAAGPSDYTIPVEFHRGGGEAFTPLEVVDKPDCVSATSGRAATAAKSRFLQQVHFSCVLSLISTHGSLMDAGRYMTAAAVFDVTTGGYLCALLPVNDTRSHGNIATESGM